MNKFNHDGSRAHAHENNKGSSFSRVPVESRNFREQGFSHTCGKAFSGGCNGPENERLILEGKNAVWEALEVGRPIDKILFSSGSVKSVGHIVASARAMGIPAIETDRRKLDRISPTGAHQGIVAQCAAARYASMDEILTVASARNENPLVVFCDHITDPHNLGAVIRSAEVAGAHGVVIPARKSAGLNAACAKAAAGALEHIAVAKCQSDGEAMTFFSDHGLSLIGADMGGKRMYELDLTVPTLLIVGSEGEGISRIVREKCNELIAIPQRGHISSLNASNAAAILLYEALRQRGI